MEELIIQAYEEYLKILGDEIDELAPLAIAHGWKSSRFEEGEKARKKIKQIKKILEDKKLLRALNSVYKEHYPNGFPESKPDNYDPKLDIFKNGDHLRK
jgi:hypothetical protein